MLFRDMPIRKKLMRIISLISAVVLLMTCVTFFIYEIYSFRKNTIAKLSTIGQIISANSTAALAFDDVAAAKEILGALKAEPSIVNAVLYDRNGKLYSQYSTRPGTPILPAKPGLSGYRFEESHLQGFQPVMLDNKLVGTLYLKSGLGAMYERMRLYGIMVFLVIAVSFLLVYQLSRILQESISKPILGLAEIAEVISDRKDYSLRATKLGEDELGALTDAFNHMLAQIQEQNRTLNESEEKFRSMIERISDAFITIDKNWIYTYVNKRAAELSGKPADYLVGKKVWDVFPEGIGQPFYEALQTAMRTQQPAHLELYYPPAKKWYEDYIYPTPESVSVYYHEITQKKKNEIALKQSEENYRLLNDELRSLSSHLQSIREEERLNMAREIHDQLGQQLTVMKMDVSWLNKKLVTTDVAMQEKLQGLDKIVDETVRMVRKIASDLRPSLLDDLGLLAAIEWHLEDFSKRSGILIETILLPEEPSLPDASKIGLFRIVQESLTNVARYAEAKKLTLSMEYQGKDLVLTIYDDGLGFDKAKVALKKTLGILGMRGRTTMMGGSYEIISSPGEGTTVIVKVPLGL